jgi:hypothetical protein
MKLHNVRNAIFLLSLWVALFSFNHPLAAQVDLVGRVTDADGAPLANASVWIYTAAPRVGVPTLCPSCYDDCRKKTQTAENGDFVVKGLDSTLVFNVLIAALGHHPVLVDGVDPIKGQTSVSLRPVVRSHPPNRMLTGRVVNEEGEPIFGAAVWVNGSRRTPESRYSYGQVQNVDKVAFTDENGEFIITATQDYEKLYLTVVARDFAQKDVGFLDTGEQLHQIMLETGVSVRGTVVRDGRPVSNHVVCVSFGERMTRDPFPRSVRADQGVLFQLRGMNEQRIATDGDGRFEFRNMIPKTGWYIHSDGSNDLTHGAFATEEFFTDESASDCDLGEFDLLPARRVAGRVMVSNDQSLPGDFQFFAALDFGRAYWMAMIAADGTFEFNMLPQDQLEIKISQREWTFTPQRQQLHRASKDSLMLRIDRDIEDLILVVSPPEPNTDKK